MEQMGDFANERVMLGNQMQMELASMHGEQLEDFIEKHAADFRATVDRQPELLQEFKDNPDSALKKLSESIYH